MITALSNPTTNVLNLKITSKINNVQIIDMAGKIIFRRKVKKKKIKFRNLPIGKYTLNIHNYNRKQ